MTIIQLGATAIEPQALGTNGTHAVKQPEYLASAQSENHSSIINPQVAALDPLQRVVPREFALAHRNYRHLRTPS